MLKVENGSMAFEFKREGMEEGGQKRNREWKVLERDERGHLSIEIDRRTFPSLPQASEPTLSVSYTY